MPMFQTVKAGHRIDARISNGKRTFQEILLDQLQSQLFFEGIKDGNCRAGIPMLDPAAPFGGVKASGIGRELGPEGLEAYLQLQSIYEAPPQAADAP